MQSRRHAVGVQPYDAESVRPLRKAMQVIQMVKYCLYSTVDIQTKCLSK